MDEKIDEPHQLMFESERYLKAIIESSIDGIQKWDTIQKGIPDDFEIGITTKSGIIKYVRVAHKLTIIDGKNKVVSVTKNITENKELESFLKESEAKYKDLFENAEDIMYTIDNQGFIRTINKSGVKSLGGKKEEIIGSHISKWLTPESLKSSMDILAKQMSGEFLEETVLIEVITKNGTHKWGESKTRILKDGDTITGVHGIVRDITEKIKLEQELKESEAKYRDLFDYAQDAMYVLDKKGNVLMKNTEVIEIISKNGEHRWIEIKTRPIMDNGKIVEVHGIGRDVTENKKLKLN